MKILLAHNFYDSASPSGENQVYAIERALLRTRGHEVAEFSRHSDEILRQGVWGLLRGALATPWNPWMAARIRRRVEEFQPDVVHVHNTFPLLSPAIFHAIGSRSARVLTLHNYRLLCPNALFFRDGHVCEDCIGKLVPWPGVLHACYRNSRAATGVTAAMLLLHRVLRTYTRMVDVYIALTDFARKKFIQGGFPAGKMAVKPNFVDPDPGNGDGRGGYALFVGRLSQEKGVNTLLEAWEKIGGKIQLKIVGDGPLASQVAEASRRIFGIEWLGHQPRQSV